MAQVLLGVSACRKKKNVTSEEGVAVAIPVLRTTFIRNFNPFMESQARWPTTAGIYEPTVIFNRATGKFVPWLADAWYWEAAAPRCQDLLDHRGDGTVPAPGRRHQHGDRPAVPGDRDLLALFDAVEECGEVCLCGVGANGRHCVLQTGLRPV
jgi:hypothetical protein